MFLYIILVGIARPEDFIFIFLLGACRFFSVWSRCGRSLFLPCGAENVKHRTEGFSCLKGLFLSQEV